MNNRITFAGISWNDFELEQALPKNVNIILSPEQLEVFNARETAPDSWQNLFELIWNRLEGIFDCEIEWVNAVGFASELEESADAPNFEV